MIDVHACCAIASLWLHNLVLAGAALCPALLTLNHYTVAVLVVLVLIFSIITCIALYLLFAPFSKLNELRADDPAYRPAGVYRGVAALLLCYPPALAGGMTWDSRVAAPLVALWLLVASTVTTWVHVRAVNAQIDDDFRRFAAQIQ